jgi:hypothetical protein
MQKHSKTCYLAESQGKGKNKPAPEEDKNEFDFKLLFEKLTTLEGKVDEVMELHKDQEKFKK